MYKILYKHKPKYAGWEQSKDYNPKAACNNISKQISIWDHARNPSNIKIDRIL